MKIAKSTKLRIAVIKTEATEARAKLENLLIRLEEHSGTKRTARKLALVIGKLDEWIKSN